MNTKIQGGLAAFALLLAGAASAGPATVTFANPEQFSDLPFDAMKREQVLADVSEHFSALAKTLPAGQELKVEVVDFDMAGRSVPHSRGANEIRVLRGGADWPTMHLRYQIVQDGKVLKSGDDTVKNMDYLMNINRYASGDTLRYEKQMLDNWFKQLTAAR